MEFMAATGFGLLIGALAVYLLIPSGDYEKGYDTGYRHGYGEAIADDWQRKEAARLKT